MTVHAPVVAGTFYPADPDVLGAEVDGLLAAAGGGLADPPRAVILPHAGYRFSGAVAAAAVAALKPGVRRVVILGPSHRHALRGVALPAADALATPLGEVPLDRETCDRLLAEPDVAVVPEAHAREHAIEVELPFLQRRLGTFETVPLVVGEIAPGRLADLIAPLWDADTLLVISTDLTHFMTGAEAAEVDTATARKVELADPAGLTGREACGHRPLSAFLTLAARQGLRLTRRALTHSGAITGDQTRVVGYGAWTAHAPEAASLSPVLRQQALRLAAEALNRRARNGRAPTVSLPSFPAPLQGMGAAFVTLTRDERLRGCIGSLKAHRPLAEDIAANAVKAGFEDPRFRPVTPDDLPGMGLEIALLSQPAAMRFRDEADLISQLRPGRDGLILQDGQHRSTFLPKVWESLETPDAFLNALKVKARLPKDHWSPTVRVSRYVTESFRATLAT